ncbi:MAG: uroporphyrinogen-III C-methyltransferase [Woeseiaceae bacterium]
MSETPDIEEKIEEKIETEAVAPRARKSGSGGVAWLALLLAIAALGVVAYTTYQDWRAAQAIDLNEGNVEASLRSLGARIDATNDTIAGTAAQFDGLAQADASSDDAIAALKLAQADIDERLRLLNSLPIRISNTEAALAAMQGVSDGARDNWLLGEAEYYMQLANAQLQLAGNPDLAALALGMADERIAQLANPALTNVRIALADEVAALAGMQTTDIEGVTLKLASIARVVETLPLRPIERIESDAAAEPEEEMGPMDRAWSKFKGATSDMIKHRTTDETVMPLISPQAEYFLRTNLALQMQTARLALLRGERQIYESSLNDSAEWLSTYFDATSSQVAAALDTIAELKGAMVAAENPDISASLRLLRRHTSVSENTQ